MEHGNHQTAQMKKGEGQSKLAPGLVLLSPWVSKNWVRIIGSNVASNFVAMLGQAVPPKEFRTVLH
jgi:hypothetical protein